MNAPHPIPAPATAEPRLLDGLDWEGRLFDGAFVAPRSGERGEVTDKATGEVIAQIGLAGAEDVAAAAAKAQAAQAEWARVPGVHRGDLIRRFAGLIDLHKAEIQAWIVRETGSVPPKAQWETTLSVRDSIEASMYPSQPEGLIAASEKGRPSYLKRVPIGIVGCITPWNSPFILAVRTVAPALALGNAVLLKPDLQTPVCGGLLIARLLELAGLPAGLLQVLPGGVETGRAVVREPAVGLVSFTGSTRGGQEVGAVAGGLLKRVSLELGGNNAMIVTEDVDLDRVASNGAWGAFLHQGQVCYTAGRHLVHAPVAEGYTERLVARARALKVGDPNRERCHLGPMINERQAARGEAILRESVAMGATVLCGGTRQGAFFQPTVVTNVSRDMPLFKEERFFPVACVIAVADDEAAVAAANDTEYGFVASVQCRDQRRAMGIADRLRTAIVHVNDQTLVHEVHGLVGGMGLSGNGARIGNAAALDEFTQWRWITVRDDAPAYPF